MENGTSDRRVLVAMSGGVDSAVAALRLLEAGYDVTGAFICMDRPAEEHHERTCCSLEDAEDARLVAARLGIRLMIVRAGQEFDGIVAGFVREYAAGRTPNPCIRCNTELKFGKLMTIADSIGARFVATGHYARVVQRGDQTVLARAMARDKDQSYVLFGIRSDRLKRMLLPLGEIAGKVEVRRLAATAGLPIHDKPESQEICFVPRGGLSTMLRQQCPEAMRPGPILSMDGHVIGQHDGAAQYTIGQRHGLGIGGGTPLYVTRISPSESAIWTGPRPALASNGLKGGQANWFVEIPEQFSAAVQIRYHHAAVPARIHRFTDDRFEVLFERPVDAVTPGQAAVIYEDDIVLGGGWIESPLPTAPLPRGETIA